MNAEETPPGYGLEMPFVLTASAGGPFDDESFTVGFELGRLEAQLAAVAHQLDAVAVTQRDEPDATAVVGEAWTALHTVGLAQADLIAMRHGFAMEALPWSAAPATWSLAKFWRATDVPTQEEDR